MKSLSHQFDATRDEILSKFRSRIQQNKRFKLYHAELESLIDIFLTRLQSIHDSETIKQLCQSEINLLEEGYHPRQVAKNYLWQYRNALKSAIQSQRIKLNKQNSHDYKYFKDGEEHSTTEHWALTYLKYSQEEYRQFSQPTITNNNLKQDSLQPIRLDLYLEQVTFLLDSSFPFELAIALAAATGRRYSEIMARGDFKPTNHPYQIQFSGQLKKRGAVESYTTFTLIPTEQILSTFDRFRTHPTISPLQHSSIEEINQLNTPINRLVKQYFQDTDIVPVLVGEAGVTIQNLRSIYGAISTHFFCPTNLSVHRFVQQKLGHLISPNELSQSKNSGSTEHYFHYYLVDEHNQPITSKGVLLPQLPSSSPVEPTSKQQPIQQLELATDTVDVSLTPGPTPQKVKSTPITTPKSKSNLDAAQFLTHITTLIQTDNYQHLVVGLMAATGLDAASLLKLLVFKQVQHEHLILYCPQLHPPHQALQQLLTLLPASSVLDGINRLRRLPSAIDFAHQRTGSEIISDVANFIPSVLSSVGLDPTLDLHHHYQQFILLIFKSTTMNNNSLSLNPDTLSKFEHWQQHFSTDVDSTLNELMRLASLSHELQNKEDSSSEPNPWLAISRLTETVANLTAKVLEQNDHLMALQSNTTPKAKPVKSSPSPKSEPTPEPTTEDEDTSPNLESLSSDELRNTRAPGAPTEKLNRALHAIIQYNQQQSEPSKMWRINPQVLQQLTGSFQANVKSFFQQHQDAIDLHNQQFHLTSVRHNASHNGQHPSEVIHW